MNDVYVCKLPLENLHGESISVYSTWTDNSFMVNVFHKDRAWFKSVSEEDLKSLTHNYRQKSVDEYLLETKTALTCEAGGAEFTYTLINSEFTWKKVVDSVHNIKAKFGSLILDKMPVSSFAETAVDFLLNRCEILKAENDSLRKEKYDLRSANASLLAQVRSLTKLKTEMEDTLYAKSLAVINAKKEKIYELQQFIETRPTTSENTLASNNHSEGFEAGFAKRKLSDSYGSETELDTDENSDQEYRRRSNRSTTAVTTVKEEDKVIQPSSSKSQKLDASIISEHLTKDPTENRDDGDFGDIFVPARRKKIVKS